MKVHTIPAAQLPKAPALIRRNLRCPTSPKFLTLSSLQTPSSTTHLKSEIESKKLEFPTKKMFILGMGYVGQFFAQELKNEGWEVAGTCMSDAKKKVLEQKGFDTFVFDAMEPEWKFLDRLKCCTHLLVSIPPILDIGDPILQHEDTFKESLVDGNLQWLCYLSTTSIYGDARGAWVDENNIPEPSSNLAKMRLKSEEGWLKLGQDLDLSTYVFRLGGIYGPGRSAIDTILKKKEMSERQKRRATRNFTSRVHVADICQALKASISLHVQRKIYNVVDDDPASRAEVFALAHQLIKQKWPGLIGAIDNSINSILLGGAEKRVSNAHIKKELGVKLLYPSYRSGLQSLIDNMEDPLVRSD
ncbi:uncharacterized protein LOC110723275 [Chenopodium quinoa]|nr:uncharacterized protein LOC110723275 [Chenopodium quinoa]